MSAFPPASIQVPVVRKSRAVAIDRAHLARACPAAKTIKLADIIDNASTIAERAPRFDHEYLLEKQSQLDVLTEGDSSLHAQAVHAVEQGLAKVTVKSWEKARHG